METIRPELQPLPERMKALPIRDRGYPVPWFVHWIDGAPEFRIMDRAKLELAIREGLCWVCGGKLGAHMAFTIGPMCAVNRTTAEPPSHLDCARWSAINCPFLSRPKMERRENDLPEKLVHSGVSIPRNPGCTLVWVVKSYSVWSPRHGEILIRLVDPERIEAYAEGKPCSYDVVIDSLRSGLPFLMEACEKEKTPSSVRQAKKELSEAVVRSVKLLAVQLGGVMTWSATGSTLPQWFTQRGYDPAAPTTVEKAGLNAFPKGEGRR